MVYSFDLQNFGNNIKLNYVNGTTNPVKADDSTPSSLLTSNQSEQTSEVYESVEAIQTKYDEIFGEALQTAKTTTQATAIRQKVEDNGLQLYDETQEELAKLEKDKLANEEKMQAIEEEIKNLAKDAEEKIKEAVQIQEDAKAEYQQEADTIVHEQLQRYIAANTTGDGMTREQLSTNISQAMPSTPNLAKAISLALDASEDVAEIDKLLPELRFLIDDTQEICDDMQKIQNCVDKKVEEVQQPQNNCCDPIGFTTEDEDGNTVRYDFIRLDEDGFNTTSDFLGAENNWSEMEALKGDDETVTADELKQGNIGLVKTVIDKDGNKTQTVVKDVTSELGDDFSIDMGTYKTENVSHDAVDTTLDLDGNGTLDQNLVGTFDVNFKGETLENAGYNTLDDVEYLQNEYNITDDTSEIEETVSEMDAHEKFFELYSTISSQLGETINSILTNIGLKEEQIEDINNAALINADHKAQEFLATVKPENEESDEENKESDVDGAKKADETEETEETESTEETEETDKDEDKDEEDKDEK